MSFLEDFSSKAKCEGCGGLFSDLRKHQNECQLWHMKKVIARKNDRDNSRSKRPKQQ